MPKSKLNINQDAVGIRLELLVMLTITYGSRTDDEIKLATSMVIFAWMKKEDRIFKMIELRQKWTPIQVYNLMKKTDPDYQKYLEFAGINEKKLLEQQKAA